MNRKLIISFIIFALLVGMLIWLVDGSASSQQTKQKKMLSDWEKMYDLKDKNPRNISFFIDLLKAHLSDSIYFLDDWNNLDSLSRYEEATYLFIGNEVGMSNPDYESLLTLVDSGATLYMSFNHLTSNIYKQHFEANAFNWDYNRVLYAYISDTTLPFYNVYQNDTIYTDWYTFEESSILDTNYRSYLFAFKHPFAFYEKRHKGKIHFHSIPNLFENIQVIQPNGYIHAKAILNHIQKDKPVIFLSCANHDSTAQNTEEAEEGSGNEKVDNSLIQFILKNEALRLAFILLLCLLLIYVIFRAKRKEAILPGYAQKSNQSLPYVETLSSIYISRNSPRGVLQVMRKNFYASILKHYYIDLSKQENYQENIKRLQERISYDSEKCLELLKNLKAKNKEVDNRHLHLVHKQIRDFYLEMGIVKQLKQFVGAEKSVQLDKSLLYGVAMTLIGLIILVRGLYLLSIGAGMGVFFIIPAVLIIFLSSRFIRIPLLTIRENEVIVHGLFFGKKRVSLKQTIHCTVEATHVKFDCEDENSFTIYPALLSSEAKITLTQFVEFIKLQNV